MSLHSTVWDQVPYWRKKVKNRLKQHWEGETRERGPIGSLPLPRFYCRRNHDKKVTKLPPLPFHPTKKTPGNPKCLKKKLPQSVKITKFYALHDLLLYYEKTNTTFQVPRETNINFLPTI